MKVRKADVWYLVSQAFPDYTGRKFAVTVSPTVQIYDTNWDGGTRNRYAAVALRQDGPRAVHHYAPPPWLNFAEGSTVEIPKGVVVVEHSVFMGKDMGITVYARPDDMTQGLPAAGGGSASLEGVRQAAFLGTLPPLGPLPVNELVTLPSDIGDILAAVKRDSGYYVSGWDERFGSRLPAAITEVLGRSLGTKTQIFLEDEFGFSAGMAKAILDAVREHRESQKSGGGSSRDARADRLLRTRDSSGRAKSRKW